MKQSEIISRIKSILPHQQGIRLALLIGSWGRGEGGPNSDIDIQLLIDHEFITPAFIQSLNSLFDNQIIKILQVRLLNKVLVYLLDDIRVEFLLYDKLEDIRRYYAGSEIIEVEKTILYIKEDIYEEVVSFLSEVVQQYKTKIKNKDIKSETYNLIDKFIYEFESCSALHRRSDAYRFYFTYNIALHTVIQIINLLRNEAKLNFLPRNVVSKILSEGERDDFYKLRGTLFLPEANRQKRKLLNFFYSVIDRFLDREEIEIIRSFLESIYERDFLWNFRDISRYNSKIKRGIIYRSANLSIFQNESVLHNTIDRLRIKRIIDLRSDDEVSKDRYSEEILRKVTYLHVPFDPPVQPDWCKERYHYGTGPEIAYRLFATAYKKQIKRVLESIIDADDVTVIHCNAGKDRTGIVVSLLHLLVDSPLEVVYADYLASEVDTSPHLLNIVLDIINQDGGITSYLTGCGLNQEQLQKLKNKLLNGS